MFLIKAFIFQIENKSKEISIKEKKPQLLCIHPKGMVNNYLLECSNDMNFV